MAAEQVFMESHRSSKSNMIDSLFDSEESEAENRAEADQEDREEDPDALATVSGPAITSKNKQKKEDHKSGGKYPVGKKRKATASGPAITSKKKQKKEDTKNSSLASHASPQLSNLPSPYKNMSAAEITAKIQTGIEFAVIHMFNTYL